MLRNLIIFLALMIGADSAAAQTGQSMGIGLDHIILGTGDLAWGTKEFTRLTGVTPKFGGQHPGRGTQNALASLGDRTYLELLAPVTATSDAPAKGLRPSGFALHTTDLPLVIQRLKSAGIPVTGPLPGSRLTPDGAMLRWQTANVGGPGLELAPFFIQWDAATTHPSASSPAGCRLHALEIVAPDTTSLHRFFSSAGYEVTLQTGANPLMRVSLDCPSGRVDFTSR